MNINWTLPFGIRITRGKTDPDLDLDLDFDPRQLGQSQQLAKAMIRNIARSQTAAMKKIEHGAHKLTCLVLWISIPHQMLYVMDKTVLHWDSFNGWLHSLAALTAAVGLPFVCDWLTVLCVRLVGAPVARWYARLFGFLGMVPAVAGSSWINFHAPGDPDIRNMIGTMVLAIPIAQGVRVLAQYIAWKKLRKMESQIAEQVDVSIELPPPPAAGKHCLPGCTCGKHTPHKATPTAAKAPTTRKPRSSSKATAAKKAADAAAKLAAQQAAAEHGDPNLSLLDDAASAAAEQAIAEAEAELARYAETA